MKVAILGAGSIAATMAKTISAMKEDVCLYAIASREEEKAQAYARTYGFEKAYGSYEEMLADPCIDLVYIAVPHSLHHRWTMEALRAGKHVLCEKAFAPNSRQAIEMVNLSEEKGLLLAEAIWTRYMPSRQLIQEVLDSRVLGELHTLTANLGYPISTKERLIRPELAGGCLLDLTVYPLNFASMVFGNDISFLNAHCIKTNTGVDGQNTVMITYADGKMATLFSTMYTLTNRNGYIYGTEGYLEVVNINNPQELRIYDTTQNGPQLSRVIPVPEQISGYEYEILSCKKAMEEGKTSCPEMPHEETLEIMKQMDIIRSQFGIVFSGIE